MLQKMGTKIFGLFVLEFYVNYGVWQLCNWTASNFKKFAVTNLQNKAGIFFLNVFSVLISHCSEWLQLQDQLKI